MSEPDVQDTTVAEAFEELRTAQIVPPDPMPFVRASVSRRRTIRRVWAGGVCLVAAVSAAVVIGPFWTAGGDPAPVAADSSFAESPAETAVDLSSPGVEPAHIGKVTVRCVAGEVEGRSVDLLTLQSVGETAPLLRLQTESVLAEGTTLTLPLDDTGGSTAQPPALFEIYAALRGAHGAALEASSTSASSRGTLKVISSSCAVGEPVAMDLDVWLGPESGDQSIRVVGRVAGTVVD